MKSDQPKQEPGWRFLDFEYKTMINNMAVYLYFYKNDR